ncbi:HIT domain-containing protein [Candidatus Woesearchaeota archaeon]|nr:HIT domain-containing protein [Candidatus Woesearchaeota archaeon]
MAEKCIICRMVDGEIPVKKVYEDDDVLAILDFNGANPGHAFVIPKKHIPILEQIPNGLAGKLFNVANKISSAIFDSLNVEGTNIFVANGVSAGQMVAHFMINIIPRKNNDNISLQWQPKKLSEEEMSTIELSLKKEIENIGFGEKPRSEPKKKKPIPSEVEGEESCLIKSLRRIP